MPRAELKETHNGFEVINKGEAVGRLTKHPDGSYSWHSYLARSPMDKGREEKESAALAHLGYRRVPKGRKKRGQKKGKQEGHTV